MLLLRVSLQEFGVTQSHTSKNMNIIVAAEFPPVELFFLKKALHFCCQIDLIHPHWKIKPIWSQLAGRRLLMEEPVDRYIISHYLISLHGFIDVCQVVQNFWSINSMFPAISIVGWKRSFPERLCLLFAQGFRLLHQGQSAPLAETGRVYGGNDLTHKNTCNSNKWLIKFVNYDGDQCCICSSDFLSLPLYRSLLLS